MPQEPQAAKPKGRKTRHFTSFFSRSTPVVNELPPKPAPNVKETIKNQVQRPVEKPTPALEKRQSKLNLFDIFSKPKVEVAYGHHEAASGPLPERSQTPAHFYGHSEKQQTPTPLMARPSSRLNGPIEKVTQPIAPSRPRPPDDWDPPPLFQAYPQAVKHGALQGTNLSTETLLRAQHYWRNGLRYNAFGSTTSLAFVREGPERDQVAHEAKTLASRRFSTISDSPELVEKIFVLVTSGRLCQYSGDGNYDRLPEKVLQLGETSAAFACDLIPGKHWVVQVVQAANEQGVATINKSRSLLSRLRMPTSASRRTSTSFLLVFNSAEEMGSWLRAVRKSIDQMNGNAAAPAKERHSRENTAEKIKEEVPTHRFQVQRPLSMMQSTRSRSSSAHTGPKPPRSPTVTSFPSTSNLSKAPTPIDSPQVSFFDDELSPTAETHVRSIEAPSLSTTVTSNSSDRIKLEQLREGSRASFISVRTSRTSETENGTVTTSQNSSSPPSPVKEIIIAPAPPARRNTGTFKSSFVTPHAPYTTRRLSAQPIPVLRAAATNLQAERIGTAQRYPPLDFSDRFWLTKPSPVPSAGLKIPRSRTSQAYYPTQKALRPLSSDKPAEGDNDKNHIRPKSVLGQLPNLPVRFSSRTDVPRVKPFFRPLPIRPSEPSTDVSNRTSQAFAARRFSSLPTVPTASSSAPDYPPPRNTNRLSYLTTTPSRPPSVAPPVLPPSRASTRFSVVPSRGVTPPPAAPFQPSKASTRVSVIPIPDTPSHVPAPAVRPPSRAASSQFSSVPEALESFDSSSSEPQTSSARSTPPQTAVTGPGVITRARAPSYSLIPSIQPTPTAGAPPPKTLRRPMSMQIRSDPAPFLSSRRTSSTSRASLATNTPAVPVMHPGRPTIRRQASMSTILIPGLPPPAPPPRFPLPPPPPVQAMT
ncbi:hypothetical protein EJ08DRAFT_661692 [Tothia fuscella]|uniref:PH domain-containing protein n=1 Tax=Tothia fuscella TaxID=1048955 RepID=A0A9P4NQD8_9PEZI|nr:hypothetical protein EJ08DRAFT_661692 [Tothia fuscella]